MIYPFHIRFDGRTVAEACEASGLGFSAQYKPITLKRVITRDAELLVWMRESLQGAATSRDLAIDLHDEDGRVVAAFAVNHAWISKCTDPIGANEVTFESVTLENLGCPRVR